MSTETLRLASFPIGMLFWGARNSSDGLVCAGRPVVLAIENVQRRDIVHCLVLCTPDAIDSWLREDYYGIRIGKTVTIRWLKTMELLLNTIAVDGLGIKQLVLNPSQANTTIIDIMDVFQEMLRQLPRVRSDIEAFKLEYPECAEGFEREACAFIASLADGISRDVNGFQNHWAVFIAKYRKRARLVRAKREGRLGY